MTSTNWIAAAAVAVTLCAGATAANAGATITGARGQLSPTATSGTESGRYKMFEITRSRATVDRVEVQARGLNVGAPTRPASRPAFHVFLIDSNGTAADFGAMRVNRIGNARFLFDSRHASFPAGVTTITAYSGGTIEVRDASGSAVLTATLASF